MKLQIPWLLKNKEILKKLNTPKMTALKLYSDLQSILSLVRHKPGCHCHLILSYTKSKVVTSNWYFGSRGCSFVVYINPTPSVSVRIFCGQWWISPINFDNGSIWIGIDVWNFDRAYNKGIWPINPVNNQFQKCKCRQTETGDYYR